MPKHEKCVKSIYDNYRGKKQNWIQTRLKSKSSCIRCVPRIYCVKSEQLLFIKRTQSRDFKFPLYYSKTLIVYNIQYIYAYARMRAYICTCIYARVRTMLQVTCMWRIYMWRHDTNGFKDVSPLLQSFPKYPYFYVNTVI